MVALSNPLTDAVSQNIAQALKDDTLGEFGVRTRTDFQTNADAGFVSRINHGNGTAQIIFDITHPQIESDPDAVHYINTALSQVKALQPYVNFNDASPNDQWKEAAATFKELQALAPHQIPAQLGDWFDAQSNRNENERHSHFPRDHAMMISRNDNFITASIDVPSGVNADEVEKLIEGKKTEIVDFLGKYVARKFPQYANKPLDVDFIVTTQSHGDRNRVNIDIHSKAVTEAMKQPGGLKALSAEEQTALKENNPLMHLKDGDGKSPENPAELQKAIARAIFQNVPEVLTKVGRTQDVLPAFSKPLQKLAAQEGTAPEVKAKIEKFLTSDVLKDCEKHREAEAHGKFEKKPLQFDKVRGDAVHYQPGLMTVTVTLPKDKLASVLNELAKPQAQGQHTAKAQLARETSLAAASR